MKVSILSYTANPLETIYIAYRTCYSKNSPTEIKIPTREQDNYLFTDTDKMAEFIKSHINHTSPMEHVSFTFAIEEVSRALSHQLVRHRLASYSQQSQRYVDGNNFDFFTPEAIKDAGLENKYNEMQNTIKNYYLELQNGLNNYYKNQLEGFELKEKCNENARYILSNACFTNLVMTMNLVEFRHFYGERSCKHAQDEIQELAKLSMDKVKEIIPFADYKAKKCGITCNECFKKDVIL